MPTYRQGEGKNPFPPVCGEVSLVFGAVFLTLGTKLCKDSPGVCLKHHLLR